MVVQKTGSLGCLVPSAFQPNEGKIGFPVCHLAFSGLMERKKNIIDAIAIILIWLIAAAVVYMVIMKTHLFN